MEVLRFRYNGYTGNGQIFVMLHEVVRTGAAYAVTTVITFIIRYFLGEMEYFVRYNKS